MRRETREEREAWTAKIEGREEKKRSKYGNNNQTKEGGYHSNREAEIAMKLDALQRAGEITNLREQVPIVLVPGKNKVQAIKWIADFVYDDLDGVTHYMDAKGCRTAVYKLKKKLAYVLHDIVIEEV